MLTGHQHWYTRLIITALSVEIWTLTFQIFNCIVTSTKVYTLHGASGCVSICVHVMRKRETEGSFFPQWISGVGSVKLTLLSHPLSGNKFTRQCVCVCVCWYLVKPSSKYTNYISFPKQYLTNIKWWTLASFLLLTIILAPTTLPQHTCVKTSVIPNRKLT